MRKGGYPLDAFGSEKSAGVPWSIEHFFRSERAKRVFRFDARNGSYFGRDPYLTRPDEFRLKIFHEGRKRRILVGELIYDKKTDRYELLYDKNYAYSKNAISISPSLDLFTLRHQSDKGKLFPSFLDRIPDKSNPAYSDYCKAPIQK